MPQPGWYADPDGTPKRLRWWDGAQWTDHVHGDTEPAQDPAPRGGRGGPWPWVGLAVTVAVVGTIVYGLTTGLFGRDGALASPNEASPAPTATGPVPTTEPTASATISVQPTPAVTTLPAVTPTATSTAGTVPSAFPTVPQDAQPPAEADCPGDSGPGTLSDGQLTVTLPADWRPVDGLPWLDCSRAATAGDTTASVTLGASSLLTADLERAANDIWATALLDAAIPHELSRTSEATIVAGMDAWRITGTVAFQEQEAVLAVLVVDAGAQPSAVLTFTKADDATGIAALEQIMASVRAA